MKPNTEKRGTPDYPLYKVINTDTYEIPYVGRNYFEADHIEKTLIAEGYRATLLIDYGETHKTNMEERNIKTDAQTNDMVNQPPHYTNAGIECIDAMEEVAYHSGVDPFHGYLWLNAFKYLWRWPYKNGIEDLKKCRWYVDKLISKLEAEHVELSG